VCDCTLAKRGRGRYVGPASAAAQPGLKTALQRYNDGEYVIGETYCLGCASAGDWVNYFTHLLDAPYGRVQYLRVYNLAPFLKSPGALDALRHLTGGPSVVLV